MFFMIQMWYSSLVASGTGAGCSWAYLVGIKKFPPLRFGVVLSLGTTLFLWLAGQVPLGFGTRV